MSALVEYQTVVARVLTQSSAAPAIRSLLVSVAEAWAQADDAAGEGESRRWSPVCDCALALAQAVDQ